MKRPVIVLACALSAAMASGEPETAIVDLTAPPTPVMGENPGAKPSPSPRSTAWTIGDPTGDEQLYLELINRARDNPAAEGTRLAGLTDFYIVQAYNYWGVNLNTMKSEMANPDLTWRAWPLAMNARLLASARQHSGWMRNNGQSHTQPGGGTIEQRIRNQGYQPTYYAENIFNAVENVQHGHASFEVDWGSGPGGMQPGRLHRQILHGGYREIGIGIAYNGSKPQWLTQDLATAAGTEYPFITGVAYFDMNGNNFYDPGEGIGGLRVDVEGASYHGLTAASGGYAVPVPATAMTRAIRFSGNGFDFSTTGRIRTDLWSIKVDFKPAVTLPAIKGPATRLLTTPVNYTLTRTPGASRHEWRYMRRVPAATDETGDTSRITSTLSNPLATVSSTVSYRLHHGSSLDEVITCRDARHGGTVPVLRYLSRLATANAAQKAYVQVSTDNGLTWSTVETQSGTGGSGQSTFSERTVPLPGVAGKEFLLRFYYDITGSPIHTGSGSGSGWFIDRISFDDVLDTTGAATGAVITEVPLTDTIAFNPPATGEWLLSARPVVAGRTMAFGPVLPVTATAAPTYNTWATEQETAAGLPAGTLSSGSADHNRDGVPNLVAYALGGSPVQRATHLLPQPVRSGGVLSIDYTVDTAKADITVTPQVATSLQTWFTPGQAGAPAGFAVTVVNTNGTLQTRRASVPVSAATGKSCLLRLRVTRP